MMVLPNPIVSKQLEIIVEKKITVNDFMWKLFFIQPEKNILQNETFYFQNTDVNNDEHAISNYQSDG